MHKQIINASPNRYQLIPRTLVFIKNNDKYLLIYKNNQSSFGFDKINGVGGHIEKGEEPFESALREIAEETGLNINNLELTALLFIDTNSNPGIVVFLFKAQYSGGEIIPSIEGELKWMSFPEIEENTNVVFDVPELIKICEIHTTGDKPLILKYSYNDSGELRIVKS